MIARFALQSAGLAAGTLIKSRAAAVLGLFSVCSLLAVGALPLSSASAQVPASGEQRATRAQLKALAESLTGQLAGGTLKPAAQAQAQAGLAGVQARLLNGDFRVGDRFLFSIVGDSVKADSASVREGYLVQVTALPDLSVMGVLRSELNDHVSTHVARYLKHTVVRTSVLTRVSVTGAVTRPGYVYVPPDRPISDLVMLAGGATDKSLLSELEIRRNGRVIFTSKASKLALREGKTFEQLDVQSGDEIRIPTAKTRKVNWGQVTQLALIGSSLAVAFFQVVTMYYRDK